VLATLFMSNLSMIHRCRWTVRGDKGSIVSEDGDQRFLVKRIGEDGKEWSTTVSWANQKGDWHAYYRNVCAHIRDGEPLIITAESAGRVISVLDAADTSAEKGGAPVVPHLA
jgi:predicted dehydrogenase